MATALFDLAAVVAGLEAELGATPEVLAGALRISPRTLKRWRDGDALSQAESRARLQELRALRNRVQATFTSPDMARSWMNEPNRVIGGLRPLEALHVGRLDTLNRALEALDAGIFV
jgi:uncharacterized protein (DUF2384 family)